MLNEIAKTKIGRDALIASAKMLEKFPLPDLTDIEVINGADLPQGVPLRLVEDSLRIK